MMMVRKRVLALALVLCLIVLAIPTAARAESPTVFEVSTNEELAAAATQIRGATEGDFVISLQADLTPESCSVGTAGTANVNVTILGNGHTISGIRNFDVSGGTHLTMGKADGTDTLTVVGVNNIETVGIVYVGGKNASFTMYDGVTLKDHQGNNYFGGGVTVRSGTFKMYGGTIENCGIRGGSVCFGGGVAVYGGGAFYMYGGTIKDCYALTSLPSKNVGLIPWGAGGGVFIGGGSTFYMEGGTIENCQASETGGGVFVVNSVDSYYANSGFGYLDSQFEMTGGKITGCSAPYYGGGVAVNGYYVNASGMAGITPGAGHPDDPGVFLTGGEISGNQAEVCGGGLFLITLNTDNAADAVKICNNTADGEGADLFVQSASVTLSDPGKWGVTYLGEPDDVTGKIIDGWYEDFEGERFADQDGDSRVQVTEYETLTADSNTGSISLIAAANPREVTVSFDANGHGTAPQAQTIPMGGTAVKPQDPQERGWVFGGWYMEPACVTEFDFTTPVSENITLYAKWTRAEVTVCFDANGHGTAPQAQTVFMDDTAQRPQDPTEEGWVFGGWYTEPACATEFDFTTPVSENITLYAKWTRAEVTVRFDANGHGTAPQAQTIPMGGTAVKPQDPQERGWVFGGWYMEPACVTEFDFTTPVSENITLYAKWTPADVPETLNGEDHYAYIIGYSDGTVRPGANMTRAEAATIFFRLLNADAREANLTRESSFTDVPKNAWFATAVSTLAKQGILKGVTDTTFQPEASITRAELVVICVRFHGGANGETSQFPDVSGHWAESEIARAASLGWVDGYEDGTFRPDEPITRAEAVTLINRVLKRLPESGDALLKDMNVWPDCQPGDWYYLAIQEASNSHDYKYTKGFCETWTGMRQTPDWKQYEAVAE